MNYIIFFLCNKYLRIVNNNLRQERKRDFKSQDSLALRRVLDE